MAQLFSGTGCSNPVLWNFRKLLKFNLRAVYSTCPRLTENDVEEIRIPVPWGHIAGKWWGKKDDIPILGIHGWQDNANTFDRLVPFLNISNFVAMDLPGHGSSSHLPLGKIYNFAEYLFSIRRVVDYFKWSEYALFGHSFGATLTYAYSSLYPKDVIFYVSIECVRGLLQAYNNPLSKYYSIGIDKILETEEKSDMSQPAYTLTDVVQSLIEGSLNSVDSVDSAMVLLERGAQKYKPNEVLVAKSEKNNESDLAIFLDNAKTNFNSSEIKNRETYIEALHSFVRDKSPINITDKDDGYVYKIKRDPRVKVNQFGIPTEEIMLALAKYITCSVLSVKAEKGFLRIDRSNIYETSNRILKEKCKHFEEHEVKGTHHCHLNEPQHLAPIVNSFLKNINF